MKFIVEINAQNNMVDSTGMDTLCLFPVGNFEVYEGQNVSDTTLQLVKQGVTVDEIIKLKNADLL